jgi:hypothetical protein
MGGFINGVYYGRVDQTPFEQTLRYSINMKNINYLLPISIISLLALNVQAAMVINDNFQYGTSDIADNYGNWVDGSSNVIYESSVDSSWVGDTDYAFVGSEGSLYAFTFGSGSTRGGTNSLGQNLTGEIWFSALIREATTTGAQSGSILRFEESGTTGDGIGMNGGNNLVTYQVSSNSYIDSSIGLSTETWLLWVGKLTINSDAPDSISVWVFDSTSNFGQTEASLGSATYSNSTMDFGDSVGEVFFGGYNGNPDADPDSYLGSIRISDAAGDIGVQEALTGVAVPEPSTFALFAGFLALGGVMLRRRMRG